MATIIDELFGGEPDQWIDALPTYQSEHLRNLKVQGRSLEDIADIWLRGSIQDTRFFGTSGSGGNKNKFFEHLRDEVVQFICSGKKYQKERAELFGKEGLSHTFVISAISVYIAPHVSAAPALIAPAIALIFAIIGKISINAWCRGKVSM
jgi:hypothetical protein